MGLEAIFGEQVPLAARVIFAFVAVMVLLALFVLALRHFGRGRMAGAAPRRGQRLGVVEYTNIDGQRKLVIVRRDGVEHLVMIGGPNDIVVERNIVRAEPAAQAPRPVMRAVAPPPRPAQAPTPAAAKPSVPVAEPVAATPQPRG